MRIILLTVIAFLKSYYPEQDTVIIEHSISFQEFQLQNIMFKTIYKPHRRLKRFLAQSKLSAGPQQRIDIDLVKKQLSQVFHLGSQDGVANFHRLIEMIYEPHAHESTRLKLLIFLHYVMIRNEYYCDEFQKAKKQEFQFSIKHTKTVLKTTSTGNSYTNNTIVKSTNTSCRSNGFDDISYADLSEYLHAHLTLPYYAYIMKVSVNVEFIHDYSNSSFEDVCNLSWKIINMIKSVTVTKRALTNMGRYYLAGCEFVLDLIEIIGTDISDMYGELEAQISYRVHSYERMGKAELDSLIALTDEVSQLNQQLFIIFYNRYFHKLIKGIEPEKWLTFDNELIEKIRSHYNTKFGKIENKTREKMTKTKRKEEEKGKMVHFSCQNMMKEMR